MPQQTSPFIEGKYGWSFGEGGWNTGMDENLLKFSYMFDKNVNGIVGALPSAVNGEAYFLTTDNRLYFAIGTTWFSCPTPKWSIFTVKTTGVMHQFNGTTTLQIDNPANIDVRLDAVELTISTLGTAAFEDIATFVTQADFDIYEATLAGTTGATKVGYGPDLISSILKDSVGKIVNSKTELEAIDKTKYSFAYMTGYTGKGIGATGFLYYDSADTTTAADNGIVFVATDGGRWKRSLKNNGTALPVSWFGAVDGQNATTAFINAATYLLKQTYPGGTILVDGRYTVTAGQINFWNILATQQGITPASNFLPNGELVRGTSISLVGFGQVYSRITVAGSGDAFVWGNFTAINDKRAMSGFVRDIDFVGPGSIGHTSQVIISGAQGFSTTTNATAGTTNTNTRCLVFQECVPATAVTGCRFRYFQEAVHQTYGFGFVLDYNDVQYCNIGFFFDVGVTTWEVRSGNEIEVCAVGVYSKNTSNGSIGAAVIEANIAGCDVLIWISKFLTLNGTWFEGSVKNVVMRGDLTAPSLPNSGITFTKCVGLNIDNNGGVKDLAAIRCAMNTLGEVYAVNSGESFINVLYDNCTLNEGPFNMASISISGIATYDAIQVVGRRMNAVIADTVSRPSLYKKGLTITSSNTAVKGFSLIVTNAETTARVEIVGYKRSSAGADMQMQTQRYVGVVQRFAGSTSVVQFSTTESITTAHTSTGANPPVNVATPTVVITGAAGATQTLEFKFPTGTSTSSTAWNFWEVTVMDETGGITFE